MGAVAWPPQGIFSAKPISSAADLKGAKWRAYNPNTSRIAQLVGAQPVTEFEGQEAGLASRMLPLGVGRACSALPGKCCIRAHGG
mgnify:CR=1 FL=1